MIIAIESSSTDISLAIGERGGITLGTDAWTSDRRQGHELLPRLLRLLAGHGLSLRQVDAVAVGLGPGSFTGLRVGMSVGKGIALAVGCPILGVLSLPAWLAAEPAAVAAVGRAGARELYWLGRGETAPRIVDPDELLAAVGGAAVVAPAEVAGSFGIVGAVSPLGAAGVLLQQAAERLVGDAVGDDLARLEPAYLRAPRGTGQVHHLEGA